MLLLLYKYRRFRLRFFSLSLGFLVAFVVLILPAAASSPFFWDSIDVDIQLQADGDMLVTETQKIVAVTVATVVTKVIATVAKATAAEVVALAVVVVAAVVSLHPIFLDSYSFLS